MKRFFSPLALKVILLFILLMTVLAMAINATSTELIKEKTGETFQKSLQNLSKALYSTWKSEKHQTLKNAMLLAESEKIINYSAYSMDNLLKNELLRSHRKTDFSEIEVKMKNGLNVSTKHYKTRNLLPIDTKNSDYNLARVEPVIEKGELTITAATPLYKQGEFIGRLCLKKRLDQAMVKRFSENLQTELIFISGTEILASTLSSEETRIAEKHLKRKDFPRKEFFDLETGSNIYTFTQTVLDTTDKGELLFCLLGISKASTLSMIKEARTRNLSVSLALLTLSLLAAFVFTHFVFLSRIRKLAQGAHNLAENKENCHIPDLGQDELGDLGRAFNNMFEKIAESKEMEKQLFRAEKLSSVGQLAASVAHEIKNPLASIKTLAQLIQEETPKDDTRREYADIVVNEVNRLNSVVEQLLNFARHEESKIEETPFKPIAEHVLALIKHEGERNKVTLEASYEPDLIIFADSEKLKQVILNLFFNGMQSVKKDGYVKLEASKTDSGCLIEISDSGKGIPPELAEKIFEPFYTTKQRGTGLGLAIVKKIIDLHEGKISISKSTSGGAKVSIFLPNAKKQ